MRVSRQRCIISMPRCKGQAGVCCEVWGWRPNLPVPGATVVDTDKAVSDSMQQHLRVDQQHSGVATAAPGVATAPDSEAAASAVDTPAAELEQQGSAGPVSDARPSGSSKFEGVEQAGPSQDDR
jgi:hypothetical protein